ncbi:hypothetical protein M8494_19060 [Serratia ureilytica]
MLHDFCPPHAVTLENLLTLLPVCLPRAYSIASATREESLDLCVRDVHYERGGRTGAARRPAGCSANPALPPLLPRQPRLLPAARYHRTGAAYRYRYRHRTVDWITARNGRPWRTA